MQSTNEIHLLILIGGAFRAINKFSQVAHSDAINVPLDEALAINDAINDAINVPLDEALAINDAIDDAINVPLDEALAVRALANETCARWANVVQRTCEHRPSIQRSSEAIRGHPRPSEAIRGHPRPIRFQSDSNQMPSDVMSAPARHSAALAVRSSTQSSIGRSHSAAASEKRAP